jgi:ribosome-associated heat shock protein Hsp15
VNSERTERSDHKVGAGDVLTMTIHDQLRVWRILDPGTRRGPAPEAQGLYEDISPPPLPKTEAPPLFGQRAPGSGRPTKRDRRDTDRLTDDGED